MDHTSIVDRYYTRRYKTDPAKRRGEDVCILAHSNGVCLITVAPSHRIFTENKTICKIDFKVGNRDRALSKPNGKSKKGAQETTELASLCLLHCSDGSTFELAAGVAGALLEVNERLLEHPQLIHSRTETEGYVAIILPKKQRLQQQLKNLLTVEQYHKRLEQRSERDEKMAAEAKPIADVTDDVIESGTEVCATGAGEIRKSNDGETEKSLSSRLESSEALVVESGSIETSAAPPQKMLEGTCQEPPEKKQMLEGTCEEPPAKKTCLA